MKRVEKLRRVLKNQCELSLTGIWGNGIMSPCLKRQLYKLLKLFRARSLGLKVSQLHRPKADGPSLGKIVTRFSIYLPSIRQHVTVRILGFGARGHLTPLLPPYEGSLSFRWSIWLRLPSDSALALNNRVSLLGSYREFLWTPLPSPTFYLLTGQWLDFHQLADYHASRTALRASSNAPSGAVNCGDSIVSAFDLFMILIYLYTLISEG